MAKIIDTLVGVVFVRTPQGTVVLRAGDEIPEGASVGSHLLDDNETEAPTESDQDADETEKVNQGGKTGRTRRRSTANND